MSAMNWDAGGVWDTVGDTWDGVSSYNNQSNTPHFVEYVLRINNL